MKKTFLSTFLLIAAAILLSASFAQAGITTTGDVDPADPSTWDSSTYGYVGNTADGTLTVDADSDLVSYRAFLGEEAGTTGTITIDGSDSTWTSNNIFAGRYGNGILNITNGASVNNSSSFYLGYYAGSTGTAMVDGVGSILNSPSLFYVGREGTGELRIANGGSVTSKISYIGSKEGSSGTVTVDGADSTWTNTSELRVGYQGTGELNITNGGSVTSGQGIVGHMYSGTATVDGAGSTWTMGNSYIGFWSGSGVNGTLNITNGGAVTIVDFCRLGWSTDNSGTVTVDGTGSTLTIAGELNLGEVGTGTLNITNGGTVVSSSGDLGYLGNGTVTVDGAGSTWTTGSILIGRGSGTGELSITNGGSVASFGAVTVGHGSVTVDGSGSALVCDQLSAGGNEALNILNDSTVTITNTATFGGTGTVNFGDNGGTLTAGTLKASPDRFTGTGTIFTQGYYGDLDVLIDASRDAPAGEQVATWNGAGQNIAVYLDLSGSNGIVGDFVSGYENTGSLVIMDGRSFSSADGYIGYLSGSNGTALVSGAGSTWTLNGANTVGHAGTGALNIGDGGSVSAGGNTFIGNQSTGAGSMVVNGPGSTYATGGDLTVGYSGKGSLRIFNGAAVNAGGNTHIGFESTGAGSMVVKGSGSKYYTTGEVLTVGYSGEGSLMVANGATVSAGGNTHIGLASTGAGSMVVKGPGSTYATGGDLNVGYSGKGSIRVIDGGSVSAGNAVIGNKSTGVGHVVVNGTGSTLSSNGTLVVGFDGAGNLSISDGGAVSAKNLATVNNQSLMSIDVGKGSSLAVDGGAGNLINQGTIRLTAGAAADSGTYTPISAGAWVNTGTIQALGGVWDQTNHAVTVSDAATVLSDEAKTIDLFATQRLLIVDAPTAQVVGASFMAADSSTDLTFTASVLDSSDLSLLESYIGSGEEILAGWDFAVGGPGYSEGDPVYLSFDIGDEYDLSVLALWNYDGSNWSEYIASDLAYDSTYAGFTVTDFSGYAVTASAPVPIPGAVWLLGSGLLGLVGIRRRRK